MAAFVHNIMSRLGYNVHVHVHGVEDKIATVYMYA